MHMQGNDIFINEPPHDKTNKMTVRPAKTQISLGICPVWSESSLSTWRKLGSLATHWAHSEDSNQTGRMPRLIWVFAGRTVILLFFSCGGSNCCILQLTINPTYNNAFQSRAQQECKGRTIPVNQLEQIYSSLKRDKYRGYHEKLSEQLDDINKNVIKSYSTTSSSKPQLNY